MDRTTFVEVPSLNVMGRNSLFGIIEVYSDMHARPIADIMNGMGAYLKRTHKEQTRIDLYRTASLIDLELRVANGESGIDFRSYFSFFSMNLHAYDSVGVRVYGEYKVSELYGAAVEFQRLLQMDHVPREDAINCSFLRR